MPIGAMCGPTQGIREGEWRAALDWARRNGLEGVLFPTPRSVSPTLDAGELREVAAAADAEGLFLETGIGLLGPVADPAALQEDLRSAIAAAAALGCDQFYAYTRTDRDPGLTVHRQQLDQIAATLDLLRPVLTDYGCRLNVKTHEDLSSFEVLQLVEDRSDPDHFGIGLDTANLVVRGEDPVQATHRLAPHVHQTQLEDVSLFFIDSGLRRRLRPCGAGVLDWSEILSVLLAQSPARHLVLEQHRGRFVTEIFDDGWFAGEPHLRPAELARLVRHTVRCEADARHGIGPTDQQLEAEPDDAGRAEQVRNSVSHLRSTLSAIGAVQP